MKTMETMETSETSETVKHMNTMMPSASHHSNPANPTKTYDPEWGRISKNTTYKSVNPPDSVFNEKAIPLFRKDGFQYYIKVGFG